MSEYIGIDFGTTNTAVIKIDDKNKNAKLITKLGENGEYPFASMIAINKNDGRMMFVMHAPNVGPKERPCLIEVEEKDGRLVAKI